MRIPRILNAPAHTSLNIFVWLFLGCHFSYAEPASQITADKLTLPQDYEYDWVQLNSLEMLKGEIKNLYEETLEFESDELDTLFFDWEDIKALQSSGVVSAGFINHNQPKGFLFKSAPFKANITRTGTLKVIDDVVYINDEAYPRDDLLTIISGSVSERNFWSANASIGINTRRGNSEQMDVNGKANITRRTTISRLTLDYLTNYSESAKIKTADSHRFSSTFDWFLSDRFYLRPLFAEANKDPFLNLKHRYNIGSGVGYSFIDTSRTEWNLTVGGIYTSSQYEEVLDGDISEESGALTLESDYDIELTGDIDFAILYRAQYANSDTADYTHHTVTELSFDLTEIFDLDISLIWDRTNHPKPTSSITPKENDWQLIIGIGIDI